MPDDTDAAIANLAVDLNEESKAKRRGRPPKNRDAEPAPGTGAAAIAAMNKPVPEKVEAHVLSDAQPDTKPDYTTVNQPHFPVYGESWRNPETGVTKWWHGSGWYLNAPGAEETEARDNALTEKALADLPTESQPESNGEALIDKVVEAAADVIAAQINGENITDDPPFERDDTNFEPEEFDVDEEVETAIDRVGASLEGTGFDPRSLVQDCRDFMIQLYKDRPKPWSALSQDEQRMLASQIENTMRDFVQGVVEAVASSHDHQPIRCTLESYTEKDGIKATLKVAAFNSEEELAAVVGLHRARGKHVLVSVATVEDYSVDREAETEPDQPALGLDRVHGGFEEYEADHPDDDSDLADDGESDENDS